MKFKVTLDLFNRPLPIAEGEDDDLLMVVLGAMGALFSNPLSLMGLPAAVNLYLDDDPKPAFSGMLDNRNGRQGVGWEAHDPRIVLIAAMAFSHGPDEASLNKTLFGLPWEAQEKHLRSLLQKPPTQGGSSAESQHHTILKAHYPEYDPIKFTLGALPKVTEEAFAGLKWPPDNEPPILN